MNARAKATGIQVTPEMLKDPAAFEAFQKAQAGLTSALGRLIAIAENYPNLKADQSFRDLQSQLEGTLFVTLAVIACGDEDAMAKAEEFGRMYSSVPVEAAQRAMRFFKVRKSAESNAA